MKNLIAFYVLASTMSLTACVTTSTQRGSTGTTTSNARTMSVEAQARKKTEEMDKLLILTAGQKDEVMLANTVYLKVLKNLKDTNEASKTDAAKQSYLNKLKTILTSEQYNKFETQVGG